MVVSAIVCWSLQKQGVILGKTQHNSEKCCLRSMQVVYMKSACFIYSLLQWFPAWGSGHPRVSQDVSEGSQNDPLEETKIYLFFKTFL